MRLIDADKIIFYEIDEIGGEYEPYLGCSKSQIDNLPTVEAIPVTKKAFEMFEADYEARLKADMRAMLEELDFRLSNYQDTDLIRQDIQEKINELRGKQDEKNNEI